MTKRETLTQYLETNPGDMCAGCGAGTGDNPEPRWQLSPRGSYLTHDGRTSTKCRFPCRNKACGHSDCDEVRSLLNSSR